jgi:outer membrane protein TolC
VVQLEQRVAAADASVSSARAAWFPELRVSGGYIDRGRWWGDFQGEWQVGVALSYPLYTGGGRSHAIARATAEERAASEDLRAARLDVETGVDRALAALREARARVVALESAVVQSAEVTRIERLSLDVGSGTQTDYLAAEATLLAARASLIQATHAEIAARIQLAHLLGELSRGWLAANVESGP